MADANLALAIATEITGAVFKKREEMKRDGQTFVARDMIETIRLCLMPYRIAKPAPKAEPKAKPGQATDDQWLDSLARLDAYKGIDIRRELEKCRAWVSVRPGQKITRRRFVNWLNRIEPAIHPGAKRGASLLDVNSEPEGWRETLAELGKKNRWDPDRIEELCRGSWWDLSQTVRMDILKGQL